MVGKWLLTHAAEARDNHQRTEELKRRLAEAEARADREKERADEAVRALKMMKGEPGALEDDISVAGIPTDDQNSLCLWTPGRMRMT